MNISISAVIPAGGTGSRFNSAVKKQFYKINGKPVLYYTLRRLNDAYSFEEFVIGAPVEDHDYIREIATEAGIKKLVMAISGNERFQTVLNSLKSVTTKYAFVHDAVRPFVDDKVVGDTIAAAITSDGAICGLYSRDTVKYVENGYIKHTIDRNNIFMAHTPQIFETQKLILAITKTIEGGMNVTDDASAFELSGYNVKVVNSTVDNIKITEQGDLTIVEKLINKYFS